jgi:hypothetical protein
MRTRKITLQFQGLPLHISYEVLTQNVVLWQLDSEEYKETDPDLIKLAEALVRQIHGHEVQMAALEHEFYRGLQNPSYPDADYDPDDTPF